MKVIMIFAQEYMPDCWIDDGAWADLPNMLIGKPMPIVPGVTGTVLECEVWPREYPNGSHGRPLDQARIVVEVPDGVLSYLLTAANFELLAVPPSKE